MEFKAAWGPTTVSRFSSPVLQKLFLFPVTAKEQGEQRGSWQTDRMADKGEAGRSQADAALCKHAPSQSPADGPACSRQSSGARLHILWHLQRSTSRTFRGSAQIWLYSCLLYFSLSVVT